MNRLLEPDTKVKMNAKVSPFGSCFARPGSAFTSRENVHMTAELGKSNDTEVPPIIRDDSIGTADSLRDGGDGGEGCDEYVINSNGEREKIDLTKIIDNIRKHSEGLDVSPYRVSQEVVKQFGPRMTTSDLRMSSVNVALSLNTHKMDYKVLACRLFLSDLRYKTPEKFSDAMNVLAEWGSMDYNYIRFVRDNARVLDDIIDERHDDLYDFNCLETLTKIYTLKRGKRLVERPQHLFLRVAVAIHYPYEHMDLCQCETCEPHDKEDGDHLHQRATKSHKLKCCYERKKARWNNSDVFVPKIVPSAMTEEALSKIKRTYTLLATNQIRHASPTMFNAGTKCRNYSSCFLGEMREDSIEGIYDTLKQSAKISQSGGGYGVSMTKIRPGGDRIVTTNGFSNGLVPMIKNFETQNMATTTLGVYDTNPSQNKRFEDTYWENTHKDEELGNMTATVRAFNETCRYVDQGGVSEIDIERVKYAHDSYHEKGKRKGAFAIYLEPWHPDVLDVIKMKLAEGPTETRAPDLFYGLWMPDLFFERLIECEAGKKRVEWSFFSPVSAPELIEAYGKDFTRLYEDYEKKGLAKSTCSIWDLWNSITMVCLKTGSPYILYKDNVNKRNNQEHIGTIKGSNLCTEIMEVTKPDEIAVCNLASINYAKCWKYVDGVKVVDYDKIVELSIILAENLNEIIDRTRYPLFEARYSNIRHRPFGIGEIGFQGLLQEIGVSYDSVIAQEINHRVAEARSFGAYTGNNMMAQRDGPYETYALKTEIANGSKASRGILSHDDAKKPPILDDGFTFKDKSKYFNSWNDDGTPKTFFDWAPLREKIAKYGLRNSLMIAPMPTATVSRTVMENDSFEPYIANAYTVQGLVGSSMIINPRLVTTLQDIGMWTPKIYEDMTTNQGSIAHIEDIPADIKERFRTAWEIPLKNQILMNSVRQIFIDQSTSFNLYVPKTSESRFTTIHIIAWKTGCKGTYYTRTAQSKQMEVKQSGSADPVTNVAQTLEKTLISNPSSERAKKERDQAPVTTESTEQSFVCRMGDGCIPCG